MWNVFHTDWGWSAYQENGGLLQQVILPFKASKGEFLLYSGLPPADVRVLEPPLAGLAGQIRAYFSGKIVTTWQAVPDLARFTPFARNVLEHTAAIAYGETITYGELAVKAGSPHAARAVGGVMASNPVPLVIPCHRVVAARGLAGFSAPGGIAYKQALLNLEKGALRTK